MSLSPSRTTHRPTVRAIIITLILAALLLPGCGDSVTKPPSSEPDLRISLYASGTAGHPANPLSFQVVVWNAGGGEVSYYQDCCHEPVILGFLDTASGENVYTEQPVFCRCAAVPYPMPPSPLIESVRFTGDIWDNGRIVQAPGGRYAAVALFQYRVDPDGPVLTLKEAVPFDWRRDSAGSTAR